MAWTFYQKFLAVMMVVTGSINTLAAKWADRIKSTNSEGEEVKFNHPFFQACGMFLGEFLCLFTFKILYCAYMRKPQGTEKPTLIQGSQAFNPLIFLAPALCDMTGTSLMYIGMNLTYASSFQMLRGAVIVFTGLLSVAFLERHLKKQEWLGIFFVIIGLICVGMSDFVSGDQKDKESLNRIITGDLLIVLAQVIVATQMVVEEKFITKHNVPPLQGVGWEGLFGFCIMSVLLVPMYYIKVGKGIFDSPEGRIDDALDAFVQMSNSWQVTTGIVGTVLSIAFFNFAGLSVTKELSATTRMVLDSIRTFVIWIVALCIGWQTFHWLQLLGFIVLLFGMCLYNDVIVRQLAMKIRNICMGNDGERQPLLKPDEESAVSHDEKITEGKTLFEKSFDKEPSADSNKSIN